MFNGALIYYCILYIYYVLHTYTKVACTYEWGEEAVLVRGKGGCIYDGGGG